MDEYLVGQPVRVFIEDIAAEGGPIANPATITLTVQRGDGTLDTYAVGALSHDATGAYSKELTSAAGEEGVWVWRFDTTSPTVAKEGVFLVNPSALLSGDREWPRTGPCHDWTDRDEIERQPFDLAGYDNGLVDRMIEAASDVMFQLGGRRWPGVCDRTMRVGACDAPILPLPEGGVVTWRSTAWHQHGFCGGARALELPGPVVGVHEVRINGDALDPAAWTVRDWTWLVRIDGGVWPCAGRWWQDPPPLEVDYSFGAAPPALGRLAATVLATELLKATPGADGECRLDRRVTDVVREGITETLALPGLAETLAAGSTGIPEVDLFVMSHNPNRLQRPARFVNL